MLPPITYYIGKRTNSKFLRLVNWPLIFVGTYNIPPATGINFSSWYIVNLIFNKIIFDRFRAWWYVFLPSFSPVPALLGDIMQDFRWTYVEAHTKMAHII